MLLLVFKKTNWFTSKTCNIAFQSIWQPLISNFKLTPYTNSVNVNFKWSCSKGLHMNLLNCFYSLSKWTIKSCWKSHTCWLRLAFTTNEHSSRHILCISIVMFLFVVLSYVGSVTLHKRQFYWSYSGQSQPRKLNTKYRTRSFSSHGLIIIPIIWSLIFKSKLYSFSLQKTSPSKK